MFARIPHHKRIMHAFIKSELQTYEGEKGLWIPHKGQRGGRRGAEPTHLKRINHTHIDLPLH